MRNAIKHGRNTIHEESAGSNALTNYHRQLAMSEPAFDVLVLDARARQSVVAVRSLGRRGLRVAVLGRLEGLTAPAFSSRWCQRKIVPPVEEGTEEYLAYLERVLGFTGTQVLITSSDATVAFLRQHRERLERYTRIALAKEAALAIAVNKERTLEAARGLGLAVPRSINVNSVHDVRAALHEIELPLVVKPVESWRQGLNKQQKGIRLTSRLVTTFKEAVSAVEELTSLGGTTLFQQFLAGERETMNLFYAHGQIYARFAHRVKRSNPPLGGTDVLRQSIAIPTDIGEQAEQLVREIELEGYSQVEFRRDGAGRAFLMEINPRLTAGIDLAVRAGVDFPHLLYRWAIGEHIDTVEGYRVGQWMRYLGGDFAATIASFRQRGKPGVPQPAQAILDFCTSFLLPMAYDYVDWRDPLPLVSAIIGFPRYLLRQEEKDLLARRTH